MLQRSGRDIISFSVRQDITESEKGHVKRKDDSLKTSV